MRIVKDFPRSRRALLAAGGGALIGCASLGLLSLGVVNAEPDTGPSLAASTSDAPFSVRFDDADLKQQQDKFINTLAAKLGVSSDKLQQALKDTQQEVGPVPLLMGPPGAAGAIGKQGFTISITSDVSTAAKVLGISEDQLRKELDGKSLTDVAKAHNVDPRKVASAIKAAREAELDQAVQANKMPAQIANDIKANFDKEIEMQMTIVRTGNGMLTGSYAGNVHIMLKEPRP
jgi:hypothetical protein